MREYLINDLESLFNELVDQRSRLHHHLNSRDLHLDDEARKKIETLRIQMSYVEDSIGEIRQDLEQRVYCIEVTTTVEQVVKVLAKNEDDAVGEAVQVVERRIANRLGNDYDIDVYSEAYSTGDESQSDDEADYEVSYDE